MYRKQMGHALMMVFFVGAMMCICNFALAWENEICEYCGSENGNGAYVDCGELHQYVCFDCDYASDPVPHTVDCECHEWKHEPNGSACRAYCVICGQRGGEQQHVVLCHVDLTHCTHCGVDVGNLSKTKYEQIHLYIDRACVCGDVVTKQATSYFTYVHGWRDGEITITSYNGSDTFIVIPETIDGYRVTGIGNGKHTVFTREVEYIIIPDGVKNFSRYAFQHCVSLKSISLPDGCNLDISLFNDCSSLTQVYLPDGIGDHGWGLFSGCSSLKYVHIPASWTSIYKIFSGCTSLESIIIPEGVETIRKDAFMGCTALKSVTIPNSVTTITGNPFTGCTSLTDIRVSEDHPTLEVVDGVLFDKVSKTLITYPCSFDAEYYEIPYGTVAIAGGAFHAGHLMESSSQVSSYNENDRLVEIYIPDTVVELGSEAFLGRRQLQEINIPEGVAVIPDYAFYQCVSLERIDLPNSVTKIKNRAFSYCVNLKAVKYPRDLVYIEACAFAFCRSLTYAMIPYGMTEFGAQYEWCQGITEVDIPDTVTDIRYAFWGWSSIEQIILPNSIQTLGENTFCYCDSLKVLYLPESLTKIESGAIYQCPALEVIFIPDNVTEIEEGAISGSESLTIYCVEGSEAWQYAKENGIPVQSVVPSGSSSTEPGSA